MQTNDPKRILVWDLPVRLFHWLLAASFLGAFAIANLVDDESSLFALHMLLGGVMAFMVLLRVIWGFVGSRYARFGSFAFGPRTLVGYLRGALTGKAERYAGHNPGSSAAVWAMLAIALGLAFTGAFMSRGGEAFEEVHEMLAWAMVVVVALHVAGIIWHTIRHKENIARSMIDGHKRGAPSDAIPSARAAVAIAFLGLTGLWAGALYDGYDSARRQVTIPLIGGTLQLGEGEEHGDHDD
jgi:cytochrome b